MKPNNWVLITLAYLSIIHMGLSDNIRGPLLSEMLTDLRLTDFQASLYFSVSSVFSFLMGYSQQYLVHRIRPIYILKLSLFFAVGSQILMATSTGFFQLILGAVLLGLGFGCMGVLQNLLVLRGANQESMTRLQGGLHSLYAISSFAAPLLVSVSYSLWPGWRSSFFAMSVLSGLFFIIYFLMSKQVPQSIVVKHEHLNSAKAPRGVVFIFALMLSSYVACEILVSNRISLLARREFALSFELSSLYTSIFFAAMLAGRACLIFWKPKGNLVHWIIGFLLSTLLLLIVGMLLHPMALAISGFTMGPIFPLFMSLSSQRFPNSLENVTATAVSFNSFLIVVMLLLVGWLSDHIGLLKAFWIGPAFLVLSLGLLWLWQGKLHEKT